MGVEVVREMLSVVVIVRNMALVTANDVTVLSVICAAVEAVAA